MLMSATINPAAPHHLPSFITAPGETDVLMTVMVVVVIVAVALIGTFYFRLHALPEHMAHGSKKIQYDVVAVLALISLFTHNHVYWIAGLLLALVDIPNFSHPLRRIADSVEVIAHKTEPEAPQAPEVSAPAPLVSLQDNPKAA